MNTSKLSRVREIENLSGVNLRKIHAKIKPIRQGYYRILNVTISGDAPKDFIELYHYGEGRKRRVNTWPKYIAKVGKKWYPIESIVEYLLNRIGEEIGIKMAESELRLANNQIRFLSKYFLKEGEVLVHGAQIFSAYLDEADETFVEEIESQGLARELFTFQFVIESIRQSFPKNFDEITKAFLKMLVFDAITGNNDRHFYNWGVIVDLEGEKEPVFSPVYDTARGLFWNYSENKISNLFHKNGKIDNPQFEKYINNSRPKTGWEGEKDLNHFKLIQLINDTYPKYNSICMELLNSLNLLGIKEMIEKEFKPFFSNQRYKLIIECFIHRYELLLNVCNCKTE